MKNALVNLEHITKSYDGQMILDDLNLYIKENEFLTLLGPSGCGKTTTLRILGGFEKPDKGQVIFEGKDITGDEGKLVGIVMATESLLASIAPEESVRVADAI